jgi:hypothetical protein
VLDREQLDEFAERGFVVVPRAVSEELVAAASGVIEALILAKPPGPDVRGPYNYFPESAHAPALLALLTESPAFALAEGLTGRGTLEVPGQVQVALNIPPFPHRPGMHHIDGAPGEAGGRPGTFTMLAGVLMSDQVDEDAGNLWCGRALTCATPSTSASTGRMRSSPRPAIRRSSCPSPSRSGAGRGICCWPTTSSVTTSAVTPRLGPGARCTSG